MAALKIFGSTLNLFIVSLVLATLFLITVSENTKVQKWPQANKAANRTHPAFLQVHENENEQNENTRMKNLDYYFVHLTDPQFGMIDRFFFGSPAHNYTWELEEELSTQAVDAINKLNPPPAFVAITGDFVHAYPDAKNFQLRQEQSFIRIYSKINPQIPVVLLPGNHELGKRFNQTALNHYRSTFGQDYYAFTLNKVRHIVINSMFFRFSRNIDIVDRDLFERWFDAELNRTQKFLKGNIYQNAILFQHHPFFLKNPDEDTVQPFLTINKNEQQRQLLLQKIANAGITLILTGHTHFNNHATYNQTKIHQYTTTSTGAALGTKSPGIAIIKVLHQNPEMLQNTSNPSQTSTNTSYTFYQLDEIPTLVSYN